MGGFFIGEIILSKLLLLGLLTILAWAGLAMDARSETCRASYYGYESGSITASGESFNPHRISVAMPTHRWGRVKVSYRGRSVVARLNDYGPAAWTGRCIDLSLGAARALGMTQVGVALVQISRVD